MTTPRDPRSVGLDSGNPGAAVERHRGALWRYLRVLGADDATADDLVQEAFVVALQRPDFDAASAAGTFAFLRTTARHCWLKSRRRQATRREVEHADEVWDQNCDGDGSDYLAALRQCVDAMPNRSRELLEATYHDRRGRAETARAFGMTENGIKSALRRLRAALHECIGRRRNER